MARATRGKTHGEILAAAARRFAVTGYKGTSLQDIAREVGCSKAAVLYHFANKEALLGELMAPAIAVLQALDERIAGHTGADAQRVAAEGFVDLAVRFRREIALLRGEFPDLLQQPAFAHVQQISERLIDAFAGHSDRPAARIAALVVLAGIAETCGRLPRHPRRGTAARPAGRRPPGPRPHHLTPVRTRPRTRNLHGDPAVPARPGIVAPAATRRRRLARRTRRARRGRGDPQGPDGEQLHHARHRIPARDRPARRREFPAASGATGTIAVKAPQPGQLMSPEGQAVVNQVTQEAATLPGVVGAVDPLPGQGALPGRPLRADPGAVQRTRGRRHRRAARRVREGRRAGRSAGVADRPRRRGAELRAGGRLHRGAGRAGRRDRPGRHLRLAGRGRDDHAERADRRAASAWPACSRSAARSS